MSEVADASSAKIVEQDQRAQEAEIALESVRTEVSRPWFKRIGVAAWNFFGR